MASSSSSHQRNRESNAFSGLEPDGKSRKVSESSRLFDVFINHRGSDVKKTLATELYNCLGRLGIEAFLDSEEKELGNSFPSTIETAIRSAKVHIAIFSKRYAESPWCLAELVLMLQSQAKIIPVFYEVGPWELRHIENGAYATAFSIHKEKGRYLEKLSEWKEALNKVSFIAGVEFNSDCETKTIVAEVEKEVQRKRCLYVAKYPVGLKNLVEDFEKQCLDELVQDFENQCGLEERNNKPMVVAIFGMGGVGKTTLAKELFNRKQSDYSGASFLFDVREAAVRSELPHLQSQLVKDLLHKEERFRSIEEGKSYLNDHLPRSPLNFLIVVDDIDHMEQLDALLIMDIFNKRGNSLVIVTTRDVGVVISAGIPIGYPVKGMDRHNGSQLFCWHAFDQPRPGFGYEALVDRFVDVCGGLPLSLLVLGRLVHGRDHKFWESNLVKAKKTLPRDVKQRLKISFDALEDEEKQVFIDIACFFLGKPKCMAERILEVSGWSAQTALQTLKDKCLIEEIEEINDYEGTVLRMHDHLRDLGREMALELSPPHRLWRPEDLQSLELTGLQNILSKTNTRCCHSIVDNSISCRVTFFLGQSDMSASSLLWLELRKCYYYEPSECWAYESEHEPSECWAYESEHEPSESWPSECWAYESEPYESEEYELESEGSEPSESEDYWAYKSQEYEYMTQASSLASLPAWIHLQHLQCLNIFGGSFKTLWENHTEISTYQHQLSSCRDLQRVSGSDDPIKLRELIINHCDQLEELPSLSRLTCMENIKICYCDKLQNIMLPPTFINLFLHRCKGLQRLSGSGDLIKLTNLRISDCPELEELPSLSRLSCMEEIQIDNCEKLKNITLPPTFTSLCIKKCRDLQRVVGSSEFIKLTELIIGDCPKLEEFVSLSRVTCLEKIQIHSCEKLQNILLPPTLSTLSIKNCRDLQRVVGSSELIKLTELIIDECPKLEEFVSLSRVTCLEKIQIHCCEKLQNISLPTTLSTLSIDKCRDLQKVVDSDSLL